MSEIESKIGVLLLNTGTPDSPEPDAIRAYLKEFLSDRNLIDVPPFIWNIILRCFILPKRPHVTTERYKKIWTPEGSPYMVESIRQQDKLQDALNQYTTLSSAQNTADKSSSKTSTSYLVKYASRYGNPSVEQAFKYFFDNNVTEVFTLPLFPQTAFSTTKTCIEKAVQVASTYPTIKHFCLKGYSDHSLYHKAITESIVNSWNYQPKSRILFTFHSVPTKHIKNGDTYVEEIRASVSEIAHNLGLSSDDWEIAFHSRFEDSRKWVGPNVYTVLQAWAQAHVKRVAIIAPGFTTDCLETLYDCETVQCDFYKNSCSDQGFTPEVTYIPALNSSDSLIELFRDIVLDKQKWDALK